MKPLLLLVVIVVGIILCKAAAFGIILLFMYVKGKSFHFETEQWDNWLLNMDEKKLFWMFTGVYLLSAAVSSIAAYGAWNYFDFQHAFELALIFFAVRMVMTWLRYQKSGKEHVSNLIAKTRRIILKGE